MPIFYMLIAAVTGSSSNLCMRRSIDAGGWSRTYIVVQLAISALMAIALNPVRTGHFQVNPHAIGLGVLGGLVLAALMWAFGKAMEKGPAGLTIAALNAATVMPALLMALFFGAKWGFAYTLSHAIGSLLVVAGLFWAGWTTKMVGRKKEWALLIALTIFMHILLLCILQWRAIIAPLSIETTQWFNPTLFITACLVMALTTRRRPKPMELLYGTIGGILNGICIFLLVITPEIASPHQNSMIFPLFAVGVIVLGNLWGQGLYKERVNWLAMAICIAGIVIGTI